MFIFCEINNCEIPEEILFPFCELTECEPLICEERDDPEPIMYEHGLFLKRVIITMWLLGWANFVMLGSTSYAVFFKRSDIRLHNEQVVNDSVRTEKLDGTREIYEEKNN